MATATTYQNCPRRYRHPRPTLSLRKLPAVLLGNIYLLVLLLQFVLFFEVSSSFSKVQSGIDVVGLHDDHLYEFNNQTGNLSNNTSGRGSRQLISLLKNILNQRQQHQQAQNVGAIGPTTPSYVQQQGYPPQQQQQQYVEPGHQNQYHNQPMMVNPYEHQPQQQINQYPGGFYPVDQKINTAQSSTAISNPYQQQQYQPVPPQQYPLLNYPTQQHSSVPFYNDNLPSNTQYQAQQMPLPPTSSGNPLMSLLTSVLGSAGGGGSSAAAASQMLSKLGLGLPEDVDLLGLLNFGSIDGMIGRVNEFDKLKCIPRMICQSVAKRNEDQRVRIAASSTSTTTTTTTERPSKKSKKKSSRDGKFIKIGGVDTALDQFVKFLELMQLKDWSLYPYVKGAYEGHQVGRSGECAEKFRTCPFSDDQLVYYFNNYNGGFFSSFRDGAGGRVG